MMFPDKENIFCKPLFLTCSIYHHSTIGMLIIILTLGAHAQRGLQYIVVLCVCLYVCLCVCRPVYDYSRTTGYEAAYERYQQFQCYTGKKTNW